MIEPTLRIGCFECCNAFYMLLNVSYNNRKIDRQITEAVGASFGWRDRFRLGGIGSPRMSIIGASMNIQELLNLDQNMNVCNIELRPGGIIVRFRSILETYALIVPYHKLVLFKGEWNSFSIHCDGNLIKVLDTDNNVRRFCKRLVDLRSDFVAKQQLPQ